MLATKRIGSKEEVMEWMLDVQLGRRNLNKAQRVLAAEKFRKYYEKQARENQATLTGGKNPHLLTKWTKDDRSENHIHVRTKLSDKAGVGSGTYYRCKIVLDSENEGKTISSRW